MSEKLYEALEVCLNALETGADMESVLTRFPDLRDELSPILEASQQARMLAIPEVPGKAIQRGRMRVLQHAAGMRKTAAKPRRRWSLFAFPRLATSLAIALIFLLGGTGLVRASTSALPGDNLYPVKRTWEGVRLTLSFDPEIREELEVEFENERLHEVDELLNEGRHETIMFAGLVTEQNGEQWLVSGIPVQITPESKLPDEPVTIGASIVVEGRTNAQGFVEAHQVLFLETGVSFPPGPVEIERPEDGNNNENSDAEIFDYSDPGKLRSESSSNDNDNDDESGSGHDDESSDDNNNDNTNENDNDNDNENDNGNDNDDEPDEPDDD